MLFFDFSYKKTACDVVVDHSKVYLVIRGYS